MQATRKGQNCINVQHYQQTRCASRLVAADVIKSMWMPQEFCPIFCLQDLCTVFCLSEFCTIFSSGVLYQFCLRESCTIFCLQEFCTIFCPWALWRSGVLGISRTLLCDCRVACPAGQGLRIDTQDGHPRTDGMDRPSQASKPLPCCPTLHSQYPQSHTHTRRGWHQIDCLTASLPGNQCVSSLEPP